MADNPGTSKAAAAAEAGKKRARYTSVACNECKRRKIKCNGEKPCERCGNQNLECVYASHDFQDSDEYRRMAKQIEVLEGQVKELYGVVALLRNDMQTLRGAAPGDMHTIASTPRTGLSGSASQGLDVDMSRDGHIMFTEHVEHPLASHPDPLLSMEHREAVRLFALYSSHIQSVFPVIDTEAILRQLGTLREYREAFNRGMQTMLPHSDRSMQDDSSILLKMVLAVGARSESLTLGTGAAVLYSDVQDIYKRRGYPPPHQSDVEGDEEIRRFQSSAETSLRLRLLQAIWHFQQGEEDAALSEVAGARRAFDETVRGPRFVNLAIDRYMKLGEVAFTMYWIFTALLKLPPRMNFGIDGAPAINITDEYPKDEENTLRGPLFQYAKICSLMCYAFETPQESQGVLAALLPPWSRQGAVNYVHRWQTTFGDGLRSLTTIRLEALSAKSAKERTVQACVYLLANYLRLLICTYKKSDSGDGYEGPPEEYYGSAKYAQDSLLVLWNVHQTMTTWHGHTHMYNTFLVQAADWLYALINNRAIMLTQDVKTNLERALVMLEAYAPELPKAQFVLQKLRESRDAHVIGEAVCQGAC